MVNQAALVQSLRGTVAGLRWKPSGTEWADYDDHTSYTTEATAAKEALVGRFIGATAGERVWDLGANTGHYSRIAAGHGPRRGRLRHRPGRRRAPLPRGPRRGDRRHPARWSWTSPTRARARLGGRERRSLAERANADCLLALALVHHLAIGRNVPLERISAFFATLAPQLVIEFVPREDDMVQTLLATREDVFPDYTIEHFRAAFAADWEIVEEAPIPGTARTLFSFRRR